MKNVIRVFWFVAFFSIGAAALSISVLCSDLLRYYHNKQLLTAAQDELEKIKSLNTDYDVLSHQMETDPNIIRRIASVTLGTQPQDGESVSGNVTQAQLEVARKVLRQSNQENSELVPIPYWLTRCCGPDRRTVLFLAGAFLILISFIWFGPRWRKQQRQHSI